MSRQYPFIGCLAILILLRRPGIICVDWQHISSSIQCQNLQPLFDHTTNLCPGLLEIHKVMTLVTFSRQHKRKGGLLVPHIFLISNLFDCNGVFLRTILCSGGSHILPSRTQLIVDQNAFRI